MKRIYITASCCVLALSATSLQAFEFTGAEAFVGQINGDSFGEDTRAYGGSAELRFGSFGLQGDVSVRNFETGDNIPSWGLHGFYVVSDALKLGVHYSRENDWSGTYDYANTGVELAYQAGSWDIGAYWYEDRGLDDDWLSTVSGVDVSYAVNDAFSVQGRIAVSGRDDDTTYYGAGGTWRHKSGAFVRFDAGQLEYPGAETATIFGLRAGFEFGNGVSFKQRNYNENLLGYGNQ